MLASVEHKRGPVRPADRPTSATNMEDLAEEMIDGIFCQYDPPEPEGKKKKKKMQGGILRPPNSFMRERTLESQKSVHWIDQPSSEATKVEREKHQEDEEFKLNFGKISQSCIDAGIEGGCMSPTKMERREYFGDIRGSLSEGSSFSSTFRRESRAHRYTVYDDEGNPFSVNPGEEAPPNVPVPPPPSRREIFIPELCGVHLSSEEVEGLINETIRPSLAHAIHSWTVNKREDDNSITDNDQSTDVLTPTHEPVALKKQGPSIGRLAAEQSDSWDVLRNRLDGHSDEDWEGPDWMEPSLSLKSRSKDELKLNDDFANDPIARDRLTSPVNEDDWDSTLAVIPQGKAGGANSENQNGDGTYEKDGAPGASSKRQNRMMSIFGRNRKSRARDPSPGPSSQRNTEADKDQALEAPVSVTDEVVSQASSGRQPAENWRQRTALIKEKLKRVNSANTPNSSSTTNTRSRSRSRSPVRVLTQTGKKIVDGLTSFSPRAADLLSRRNSRALAGLPSDRDASLLHLHPAHPLNPMRFLRSENNSVSDPDRQSSVVSYQSGVGDVSRQSQSGVSETDDRQSYITAHRNLVEGGQRRQVVVDQSDRMSFITAHRAQLDSDQRSQAVSDVDDRMSYITAHRKYLDGNEPNELASDRDDRMSYITAYRALDGLAPPPPPPPPPRKLAQRGNFTLPYLRRRSPEKERQPQMAPKPVVREPVAPEPVAPEPASEYKEVRRVVYREIQTQTSDLFDSNRQDVVTRMNVTSQIYTKVDNVSTASREPAKTNEPTNQVGKPTQDDDPTWEERIRLEWERLRSGFGMLADMLDDEKDERLEPTATSNEIKAEEKETTTPPKSEDIKRRTTPPQLETTQTTGQIVVTQAAHTVSTSRGIYLPHLAPQGPSDDPACLTPCIGSGSQNSEVTSSKYYLPTVQSSSTESMGTTASRPRKGILKTEKTEKKVSFAEPSKSEDTENIPQFQPEHEAEQRHPVTQTQVETILTETTSVHLNVLPQLSQLTESTDHNVLPPQSRPFSPEKPIKAKQPFIGRKLFSGMLGKGKNKSSKQKHGNIGGAHIQYKLPADQDINLIVDHPQDIGLSQNSDNGHHEEFQNSHLAPPQPNFDSNVSTSPTVVQQPQKIASPAEAQVIQQSGVQPQIKPTAQHLDSVTLPPTMYASSPQISGPTASSVQKVNVEENAEGQQARLSIRGRSRNRDSNESKSLAVDPVLALSPTGNGDMAFFSSPQGIIPPHQQGYIHNQQSYPYFNPSLNYHPQGNYPNQTPLPGNYMYPATAQQQFVSNENAVPQKQI